MNKRLYGLDLLRIGAALIVLLFHLNLHFGFTVNSYKLNSLISTGNLFMSAFFILSGFVLYIGYSNKRLTDENEIWNFYKKRLISIYPVYFAYLIYVFTTNHGLTNSFLKNITGFIGDLFCIQTIFPDMFKYFGNGGTWFISVLAILYFVYPFFQEVLKYTQKYNKIILIFTYCFTIYTSIFYSQFMKYGTYYSNPLLRLPEFIIGILLAQIYLSSKEFKYGGIMVVVSAIIYCYFIPVLFDKFEKNTTLYNFFVIPIFALSILGLCYLRNKGIINIIKSSVFQYSAQLTLTFYLAQGIALRIMKNIISENLFGINKESYVAILIITFIINVLLALITHELVEKPSKKIFYRYYMKN